MLSPYSDFAGLVAAGEDEAQSRRLRQAETIWPPLGAEAFLARLKAQSGRSLRPGERGRKPAELNALSPQLSWCPSRDTGVACEDEPG